MTETAKLDYRELQRLLPERCANAQNCQARSPEALWPGWTSWQEIGGWPYTVCPHHFRWAAERGWLLKS